MRNKFALLNIFFQCLISIRIYLYSIILYCETHKWDFKADIYCLGYTIFELMNFEKPTIVKNNNKIRINSQIFNNKNIYDNDLIELVEQMYKYYIKDRPTAEEALNTLNKIEKNINHIKNNNNKEENIEQIYHKFQKKKVFKRKKVKVFFQLKEKMKLQMGIIMFCLRVIIIQIIL